MKTTPGQQRVGQRRQQQKNGVLISPKRVADGDDTLSPAEAKIVRRGEAQLKRGESKSWRAIKHALPH
jgi:hypothetical protein